MHEKIYVINNEEQNKVEISKLNEILLQAGNGKYFDLIWGPELDLISDDKISYINLDNTLDKKGGAGGQK